MKSLLYAASLTVLAACLAGCKPEEPQEPQEPQEPETPVLESLSFEKTELELNVGDVYSLEVIVSPSDAEGYTLQWESSDEAIASVSDDGEVTAVSAGTADITVSSGEISATCAVTVKESVIPVESVSVDVQQLELNIGETYTLQATVLPENATDKGVKWSSDNSEIATVDDNGLVTAVSLGETVVTVITDDGSKTASCMLTVSQKINGHDYVDLGLSVKWAACNVGAEKPSDYGGYYAWGEIETKDDYSPDNCSTTGKEISDFSGNPEYDVAAAKWGGTWRMPTADEFTELVDNCTLESEEQDGIAGVRATGPNGNSIFLPLGDAWLRFLEPVPGFAGYFWSSTPYGDNLERATYLYVEGDSFPMAFTFFNNRHSGHNVRPVSD